MNQEERRLAKLAVWRATRVQHDAHVDAYWEAARGFVRMQLHGGDDPFTGRPEFSRNADRIDGYDRDDLGLSLDY